jgi:hypothetical protein
LQVRPIPESYQGKQWLPAEQLSLQENWSRPPTQAHLGEPITRILHLRASAATVGMLPDLAQSLPRELEAVIQQYPDQPVINEEKHEQGLISTRQEKLALIPGSGGQFRLPAVEIPWWNTREDKAEVARIPERILQVDGAISISPTPQAPAQFQKPEDKPATIPNAMPNPSNDSLRLCSDPWFWSTIVLGVLCIAQLISWFLRGPMQAGEESTAPAAKAGAARERLQQACQASDPRNTALELLDLARARWPGTPPANLGELALRCNPRLRQAIYGLEKARYGQSGKNWEGSELWQAYEEFENQGSERQTDHQPGLEALNRI